MEGTVFTPSLEGMKHVKSVDSVMLAKPFLDVCKLILPVLDKFGAAMSIVKSDIGGNIAFSGNLFIHLRICKRLESKYVSDPSKFEHLHSMVQVEVESKTAKGSSSCTNGLLWLTRYSVAMKLAPNRKKFMEVICGSGDINADIEKFCKTFAPLLAENHKFLASVGVDDLKAS
ncbi:Glycolipid transfer protein 1 [Cocos nucifera]|uniref:Glycolipid transfer protein 1 n=1 Tax=Cocos nucifera TaxID=13894 RepID=A0A8K0IF04_COCNU|nr:Glycolipid transfer protein 1 [Cocos nucifera]